MYILGGKSPDISSDMKIEIPGDFEDRVVVEQNNSTVRIVETSVENGMKQKKKEEEVKEEIRMRRHSPRVALPMQRKYESEKMQDDAREREAPRRVNPKFQSGGVKFSKEAEEAKMYLFGLA